MRSRQICEQPLTYFKPLMSQNTSRGKMQCLRVVKLMLEFIYISTVGFLNEEKCHVSDIALVAAASSATRKGLPILAHATRGTGGAAGPMRVDLHVARLRATDASGLHAASALFIARCPPLRFRITGDPLQRCANPICSSDIRTPVVRATEPGVKCYTWGHTC